ncbi:MAG: transcription elongation factor GreB [Alcaligenaceae bacterium]|nr:transcription elongation factor GreB [Alcaligenaceae bacterium]
MSQIPNYMTKAGYMRLRQELEHLVKVERVETVSIVSWAASNGDRSENGDYIYGKKRLREIDRRIRFLTKRLESAEVVDPVRQLGCEQVFFGAYVVYMNQEGVEYSIQIVGVDEVDPLKGKISWISPVAKALMKSKAGDEIMLHTPSGLQVLDVLDVFYIDES